MKIAILDDYQDAVKDLDCFSILKNHEVKVFTKSYSEEKLISKLKDFEAVVLIRERTKITNSLLENLPNLKIISQTAKVGTHIDLEACKKHMVKVYDGIGSSTAPAELCWSLIMASYKNIPSYIENLKDGIWQNSGNLGLGKSLNGKIIGIWGYGKIGKLVASYAKAFGMKVIIFGSENSKDEALKDGFDAINSKKEFFKSCDIISLHLRYSQTSHECVTKKDLELMKDNSLFVNISRANLVEKNALYEVMNQNRSKRAVIDVYEIEPATLENELLLTLENVTCSPHLGFVEKSSYEYYFSQAFENIVKAVEN